MQIDEPDEEEDAEMKVFLFCLKGLLNSCDPLSNAVNLTSSKYANLI